MERRIQGITLLEVITTLAISSILFGLAIPYTGNVIAANRVTGQINMLSGALQLTRSEAVTRQQDIVICKSADQESCTVQGEWDQGYIIFVDANQDRKRSANETLLHVQSSFPANITLNYRAFGSRHYLAYQPTGLTMTNGTFTFCNRNLPQTAKALIVTKTGRVRLSDTRSDGTQLSCHQNS